MVEVRQCENYRRLSKFNRGTLVRLHLRGFLYRKFAFSGTDFSLDAV